MKIIITGVSGFVGQNLSGFLAKYNWDVSGLSLRSNWKEQLVRNADAVIHLAGKAHDTKNTSDPEVYFKVNRDLTMELFDEFLQSDIRDFFYFSSVKAVADTVDDELLENVIGNPLTAYGKSKWEAEAYLLGKTISAGKRIFIIRPCMIHGPGNKGNLTLLYKVVRKGIPWPLASFDNRRSFLGIDNLNFIIHKMLEQRDVPSGVYNIADDESLSTNSLVELMSRTLGLEPKFWYVPSSLVKAIASLGDKLRLPLNTERLKKLTESYVVSNSKVKRALRIEKLPNTAAYGLEKTIKSFTNPKSF
ncbi:NAD-dependent epimerase/dehydratase family protein [Sphingobacterium paludis]|uniref:Nucleoside-diphosphate-sugar epimerase n=1 Tax=Sphingobacterium paludis TaxID=1476465 RepID=A0A4R7D2A5_9SPHI|nr:NAD-dependent epimerase/dehydratase family protein [Sphingobacterium paludis]TDS13704.1 nucleoside-diphosphate-sugar epimerase [Sphingobacterium paludis]